jgi:hypothetical protein
VSDDISAAAPCFCKVEACLVHILACDALHLLHDTLKETRQNNVAHYKKTGISQYDVAPCTSRSST